MKEQAKFELGGVKHPHFNPSSSLSQAPQSKIGQNQLIRLLLFIIISYIIINNIGIIIYNGDSNYYVN